MKASQVNKSGFLNDRQLMLVNAKDGKFITLRDHPEIAKIELDFENDKIKLSHSRDVVSFAINEFESSIDVTVWKDTVQANKLVSKELNDFLSNYLKKDVFMVSSRGIRAGNELNFQDVMSVHIVNDLSVKQLAIDCEQNIKSDRFRPNVVIDGLDPYVEDGINEIKSASGLHLKKTSKTSRCKIIGTDQTTGTVDLTPLQYLAKKRREDGKVMFGVHFEVLRPGSISVGEKLDIF